MQELIERRTRNSKTHLLEPWPNGQQRFAYDGVIGTLHYKENYADEKFPWLDIDTTIQPDGSVRSAPYELDITFNPIGINVRSKEDGSEVRLTLKKAVALGSEPLVKADISPVIPQPVLMGNLCIWNDVFPDTDIVVEAEPTRVCFRRILRSSKAPRECQFDIEEIGEHKTSGLKFGARDAEGEIELEVERVGTTIIERVETLDRVFPIEVDPTVDEQVGASLDDAHRRLASSQYNTASTYNRAGKYATILYGYGSGMRFQTVNISQGATIDVAYLTLRALWDRTGTVCNTRITGEDTDDAAEMPATAAAFDTRYGNHTTAVVDWDGIGSWTADTDYQSQSIVSVIKEIVDRVGWAANNDLVLFWQDFDYRSTGDGSERVAQSYDNSTTYAPKLHIEYTAGGETQNITPTGIASTEAFGTATVTPGAVTVSPSAIASAEAFGTANINLTIAPSAIASSEAFGSPTVSTGAVTLSPTGIASLEAFGTAIVTGPITVTGIASAEAFGTAVVTTGAVSISPDGIASLEAFGTAKLNLKLEPTGIVSAEAFGTAKLNLKLEPSSIASLEAFGTATVTPGAVTISPSAIASLEAFGTAVVSFGAQTIEPSGIASTEAFGTAKVKHIIEYDVAASGDDGYTKYWSDPCSSTDFTTDGEYNFIGLYAYIYDSFLLFQDVTIPNGATIDEAHLRVYVCNADGTGTALTKIYADDQASPSAPTSDTDHCGRTRTTAGVDWDEYLSQNAYHNSPDIKTVIQELVNSHNYSSGNNILILHDDDESTSGHQKYCVYDSLENKPPRLHIEYLILPIISPTGIPSAEAFGTLVVSLATQTIEPTGITSAEVFGTAKLSLSIAPSSITSPEAFGTAVVSPGVVTVSPTGIVSVEAFGTATITPGVVTISPSAIASAEAFGTAIIVGPITVTGIASAEAFGTAIVSLGAAVISPSGITSAEAFGVATITPGAVTISPSGIASGETFGTAKLSLKVEPSGIASAEVFGSPQLNLTIEPSGIVSGEAFGAAVVSGGAVTISPSGIASAEAFGTATITPGVVTISPTGIVSAEAFGTVQLNLKLELSSISSLEAFGTAVVSPGAVTIYPSSIASTETFGTAIVSPGVVTISVNGIASLETFGTAQINLQITALSIASLEAFGTAVVSPGAVSIAPDGIASAEVFGLPLLTPGAISIYPDGIATTEAFGTAVVALVGVIIYPSGIVSVEAFGTVTMIVAVFRFTSRLLQRSYGTKLKREHETSIPSRGYETEVEPWE